MKVRGGQFGVALSFLLGLLAACAAGPQIEKVPRKFIDRPYTLPDGVSSWETWLLARYSQNNSGSSVVPPIPYPLVYDSSLSDDLTLIFFPLPLGIKYQVEKEKEETVGVAGYLGYDYSNNRFRARPTVTAYRRNRINPDLAFEANFDLSPEIGSDFLFSAQLVAGPLFQVSESVALKPLIGIALSQTALSPIGSPIDFEPSILPVTDARFTVPLGAWVGWSIDHQWDLIGNYMYNSIGSPNGYQGHLLFAKLVHSW